MFVNSSTFSAKHDLFPPQVFNNIFTVFIQLVQVIQAAEKKQKPALEELFEDVYDQVPSNLEGQERQLRETIKNYPGDYPSDVPL